MALHDSDTPWRLGRPGARGQVPVHKQRGFRRTGPPLRQVLLEAFAVTLHGVDGAPEQFQRVTGRFRVRLERVPELEISRFEVPQHRVGQ